MNIRKRIGAIVLGICLMVSVFGLSADAASSSISITSPSGTIGSTVTVTCTIKCSPSAIGSADVRLTYDPAGLSFVSATNMAQGGSGLVHYVGDGDFTSSTLSFSMNFKILKAGSHRISVSSSKVYDVDEKMYSPGGNGTITGKAPTTNTNQNNNPSSGTGNNHTQPSKDGNYRLKSLQVNPGKLSPAFNEWTTSYNITVPKDTTAVTISATPQSSKANVTVTGGKDLKLGPNKAQVIVVAENGASVAYTINIMRGEEEKITIHDAEYTINENYKEVKKPTGFSETKITYKEREYTALVNAKENLHLLSLKTKDETTFFIFDQEAGAFYDFVQIKIAKDKYVIPMPLSEEMKGLNDAKKATVQLKEKTFEAWQLDEEFSVLYVMNQDGDCVWYRYDSVDGTLQRYTDTKLVLETEKDTVVKKTYFLGDYYLYTMAGLGCLCVILLIALIYFIASRKQRHEGRKRKAQRKAEKQRRKEEKKRMKEAKIAEKQRKDE